MNGTLKVQIQELFLVIKITIGIQMKVGISNTNTNLLIEFHRHLTRLLLGRLIQNIGKGLFIM